MDKYFFTHSLYFYKNKLYYCEEENEDYKELNKDNKIKDNSKLVKINNRNWTTYLKDYGWCKLDINWRKKLNDKNYGLLECGANGDCLFHVIAEAFNINSIYKEYSKTKENNNICLYDVLDIRKYASNGITHDNFGPIIENYKCEDDFIGFWDPEIIENKEDLQKIIETEGDTLWGDHILLQLIQEKLNFNVIILTSDINIQYLANDIDKYENTMIIYYSEGCHFQLIGYFDGNLMKTLFKKNELPKSLMELYYNS